MAETLISPGVLAQENDNSFIAPAPLAAGAAIIGPTVKGPAVQPTVVTSYGEYSNIFGTTLEAGGTTQEYLTSLAVKSYFNQGGDSVLVTRVISGSSTDITAANDSGITAASGSAPFTLKTIGKGAIMNSSSSLNSDGSLQSGSSDNLRWEISGVDSSQGTFSLSIRRGDDNTKNKAILESFNDLSLDPNNSRYIAKVIGNQTKSVVTEGAETYISTAGEYPNISNYVVVGSVDRKTLNYLSTDGINIREASLSGSLPTAQSGSFTGATYSNPDGNFNGDINNTNTQGISDFSSYTEAISILNNQDEYVFNIVSAPGLVYENATHATHIDNIISLAENRGDAIAVVDAVNYGSTVTAAAAGVASLNSSYAANYWPWLQMQSAGRSVWAPASVVIPGVYAFTDGASAPWFAPAGLTRGGLGDVIQAERKLTRTNRDALYAKNVNPIATFPGSGISVFGQKTLQKKKSALDRVNVRRLLIDLKKFLGDTAKTLVFEQNTISTRNSFLATVNPFLNSVVQRQGLYAFRVVMDETNNTADVIDRNQLIGQIFIQPAKTAEFITLDFTIEPTGATFTA